MARNLAILFLMTAAVAAAGEPALDLLEMQHKSPKGRLQDHKSDPVIASLLASGKESIPVLIDLLESERLYDQPPFDYWPEVREGDVAFVILCDLFTDPTWKESTLPELCWENMLGRSDPDLPGWEELGRYVATHGRDSLAARWRAAWSKHGEDIVWDEEGWFFRVAGRELVPCR